MRNHVCAAIGFVFATGIAMPRSAAAIEPPAQPSIGYGSTEGYISSRHRERFVGNPFNPWAGDWCWYFQPRTLEYGDTAPVVIFLHGFALLAPDIYDRHIEHLTSQGVIVVYPQINKGGLLGLLSDVDQNAMLDRAVAATNRCLSRIGDRAEPGELFIYGHSLGGLLGAAWRSHPDAPSPAAMVLANPSIAGFAGIPDFVTDLVGDSFVELDWEPAAATADAPTVILTGDRDDIAPTLQAEQLAAALVGAPEVRLFMALTDTYAGEGLWADHMAPINNDGFLPDFAMELLGGRARTNAIDQRFYWATLDAVMHGVVDVAYDMGNWSDGTPVLEVVEL